MSTREVLIKNTMNNLNRLSEEKVREISEYTDFLLTKLSEQILNTDIQEYIMTSDAYKFLREDEDIYSVNDLQVPYK